MLCKSYGHNTNCVVSCVFFLLATSGRKSEVHDNKICVCCNHPMDCVIECVNNTLVFQLINSKEVEPGNVLDGMFKTEVP